MNLSPAEVKRFYAIWMPLLAFVNRRLRLVPDIPPADPNAPWDVQQVRTARDALWADDALRRDFVTENPAGLSADDLAMVTSWDHRRAATFAILRHLKKHSLFLEDRTVYGVLGLTSPLDEVVAFTPTYAQAVLLPWGDRIVFDSILVGYNVHLGRGIRDSLEQSYRDAVERGAVVTSLLPAGSASQKDQQAAARTTNAKVLEAFRTHLFGSGLTTKVVERDVANAAAFAEGHLLGGAEPRSLREMDSADVAGYASQVRNDAAVKEGRRRETLTGLKRLVKFLRDTERMDYDTAEHALDCLKGRE